VSRHESDTFDEVFVGEVRAALDDPLEVREEKTRFGVGRYAGTAGFVQRWQQHVDNITHGVQRQPADTTFQRDSLREHRFAAAGRTAEKHQHVHMVPDAAAPRRAIPDRQIWRG
jgi:hypothetical protein